jgi:hypothetical protein
MSINPVAGQANSLNEPVQGGDPKTLSQKNSVGVFTYNSSQGRIEFSWSDAPRTASPLTLRERIAESTSVFSGLSSYEIINFSKAYTFQTNTEGSYHDLAVGTFAANNIHIHNSVDGLRTALDNALGGNDEGLKSWSQADPETSGVVLDAFGDFLDAKVAFENLSAEDKETVELAKNFISNTRAGEPSSDAEYEAAKALLDVFSPIFREQIDPQAAAAAASKAQENIIQEIRSI